MGSSTNTTTSTSSLPASLSGGLDAAAQATIGAYNNGQNPFPNQPAPVAALNPYQTQAASQTAGLAGYQPQQVSTGYQAQQVGVQPSYSQVQNYMNPYTSSVIGSSMDELNRQLAQTNAVSDGQAAQAGAFGGDRAAIVNSENTRNANQIAAQTISGLNNQNYSQALGAAQTGQAQDLQAQESNQYAGLQAANLDSTNQRANQSAGLAGAQFDLGAANQLGNYGSQFRQATQDQQNSLYSQQRADAYYPQTAAGNLDSQLGVLSGATPRTTTTTSPGTSVTGQIAGLGVAGLGLNNLTGGAISSGVSGAYNSLFGSGSNDGNFDGASGSFADAGNDYSNLDFSFARGGMVGYDDGGTVDDGTYAPLTDQASNLPLAPRDWSRWPGGGDHPPVDPRGMYGTTGYQPTPAGPDATANLGLATALPPDASSSASAVDQALAVNPAAIVSGSPQPLPDSASSTPSAPPDNGSIPLDQMPAPAPDAPQGLAAAAPAPPSRIDQSADPSSPLPTGGLGAAVVQPDPTTGGAGPLVATPASNDPMQNKIGLAELSAGLGMMASKSHTALGAIGEGGQAGVQTLEQLQRTQAEQDLRRAQMAQTSAYQQGMLGVRGAQVGVNQTRADNQGQHYSNQDTTSAAALAEKQRVNDATITKSLAQAQRATNPTPATLQAAAMDGYKRINPDATDADAYNYVRGFAGRDAASAARMGLGQQRLQQQQTANDQTQAYRAEREQRINNNTERTAVLGLMNNNPRKFKSYEDAQSFLRSSQAGSGNAPLPQVSSPNPAPASAPGSAPPAPQQRQATPQELQGAQAAIARGVPRELVMQRFNQNNVSAPGI